MSWNSCKKTRTKMGTFRANKEGRENGTILTTSREQNEFSCYCISALPIKWHLRTEEYKFYKKIKESKNVGQSGKEKNLLSENVFTSADLFGLHPWVLEELTGVDSRDLGKITGIKGYTKGQCPKVQQGKRDGFWKLHMENLDINLQQNSRIIKQMHVDT